MNSASPHLKQIYSRSPIVRWQSANLNSLYDLWHFDEVRLKNIIQVLFRIDEGTVDPLSKSSDMVIDNDDILLGFSEAKHRIDIVMTFLN